MKSSPCTTQRTFHTGWAKYHGCVISTDEPGALQLLRVLLPSPRVACRRPAARVSRTSPATCPHLKARCKPTHLRPQLHSNHIDEHYLPFVITALRSSSGDWRLCLKLGRGPRRSHPKRPSPPGFGSLGPSTCKVTRSVLTSRPRTIGERERLRRSWALSSAKQSYGSDEQSEAPWP